MDTLHTFKGGTSDGGIDWQEIFDTHAEGTYYYNPQTGQFDDVEPVVFVDQNGVGRISFDDGMTWENVIGGNDEVVIYGQGSQVIFQTDEFISWLDAGGYSPSVFGNQIYNPASQGIPPLSEQQIANQIGTWSYENNAFTYTTAHGTISSSAVHSAQDAIGLMLQSMGLAADHADVAAAILKLETKGFNIAGKAFGAFSAIQNFAEMVEELGGWFTTSHGSRFTVPGKWRSSDWWWSSIICVGIS